MSDEVEISNHRADATQNESLIGASMAAGSSQMPKRALYARSLRETLRTTAVAYGYTLSTAATISILTTVRGKPHAVEVFLFVAGGLAAFASLELVLSTDAHAETNERGQGFRFAGALNWFSVPAALGSSVGIAHAVHGEAAWSLAPLSATAAYMLVVAAQVMVVKRLHA